MTKLLSTDHPQMKYIPNHRHTVYIIHSYRQDTSVSQHNESVKNMSEKLNHIYLGNGILLKALIPKVKLKLQ